MSGVRCDHRHMKRSHDVRVRDFLCGVEHERDIFVQREPPCRLGLSVLGERCKASRFQP